MKRPLSESVLFSGIEPKELALIEKTAQTFKAEKGHFLFFQNDPADRFYVVLSGKIKVFKTAADGKEQILMMAGPGDSFGEAALFGERIYPATAEAAENSELIFFTRDAFMALIKKHPTLAVNLIARLSMLLHHLTRLVEQLSLEDVGTRLAGYIVGLLPDDRQTSPVTVVLTEKKMVLASLLGTIPETLSRAFSRLTGLGVISVDGQEITVHDPARLADIAAGQKS